jgi:hypothetical protein
LIFDYNTVRVATIGDASKVHIWRVIGEGHMRTILLKTVLALSAVTIGVNHAADCSNIARLELGDCGTDLGDTSNDLMSRNAWIDSRHGTPLTTNLVKVRMTYTAEKDFDLNVMFARITSRDRDGSKRRFRTCSSVSVRFILTT